MQKYKSLYTMLDQCQYILANSLERGLKDMENYAMIEAAEEWKREYYEGKTDKELEEDYGWEPTKMTRDEWISESDFPDVYQTFVIDEHTFEILKDYGQFVYYNEEIDMHFWGVMHYGTAWSHVMGSVYPVKNHDCYLLA